MRRIVDYPRAGKQGVRRLMPSWRLVLGLATAVVLLGVIAFSVVYARVAVPDPNKLVTAEATVVYWADGKTELGRFSEVDGNRQSIPLRKVPVTAQHAVLAAEDRSFYSNAGISPRGIARALWANVRGGSTQGGSTITQQYVKNYFLTQDRTYTRKVREFVISLKIEQQESKATILQNYLNTIYFGRGANGIETASQAYFGHPAATLTVAESAVLAAVIRSPGLYDPISQRARAQQRMAYVLDGMVSQGWLSAADRAKVTFPRIRPRRSVNALGGTNGYLLKAVQDELRAKVGLTDAQIDQGGLRVVSTFDRRSQAAAVNAIRDELPTENAKGVRAGLAAITPGDGAVIAMYGGPDAVKQSFNAATQSVMQAGSTFKPFALAAALQSGDSLRSRYSGANHQSFPGVKKPVNNFGNDSYGRINLVTATENSVNTVYVALNIDVGPQKTVDAAVAAGIPKQTEGLERNIANVLGTASPRVIDMADAYATFAAQGVHAPAYVVRSATSASGDIRYRANVKPKRVFSKDTTADLTYALQQVTKGGSGSYAGSNLDRPVAGKTGTSSSNLSAWFTGYTPQLAAAVGIYRGDAKGQAISLRGLGRRQEVTGGSFPVRIWTAFMQGALKGAKVENFPDPAYAGSSNAPVYTPAPSTGSSGGGSSGNGGGSSGNGSSSSSSSSSSSTTSAPPTSVTQTPSTPVAPAQPPPSAPAPAPTTSAPPPVAPTPQPTQGGPPTGTGPPVTQGADPGPAPTGQG